MGQTLGLLGFGHIGRKSRKRARAFGMPVLVWSRRFSHRRRSAPPRRTSSDIEVVESSPAGARRASPTSSACTSR